MPAQPVEIEKTVIFFSGKMKRYDNMFWPDLLRMNQ